MRVVLPNLRWAARRAVSGGRPEAICCSRRRSRWRRSSSSRSRRNWRRWRSISRRRRNSAGRLMMSSLDCLDDAGDGAHHSLKLGDLNAQLPLAVGGEGVVAGATVAGSDSPLCGDPAFDQHALERWVERAFLDLEDVFGVPLDGLGDLVAVELAASGEGFEDEQVEGAGRDFVVAFLLVGIAAD